MRTYSEAEFDFAARNLLLSKWAFAKTMKWCPHCYTLRKNWANENFIRTVEAIRNMGYDRKFYSKTFVSLRINQFYYWTMGNPIDIDGRWETILINRAENEFMIERRTHKIAEIFQKEQQQIIKRFLQPNGNEDLLSDELRLSEDCLTLSVYWGNGEYRCTAEDFYPTHQMGKRFDGLFAIADNDNAYTMGRLNSLLAEFGRLYLINPYTGETLKACKRGRGFEILYE